MMGTSPDAKVTDTNVWQFAFLPSTVVYCGALPTEAFPFLGRVVVASPLRLGWIFGPNFIRYLSCIGFLTLRIKAVSHAKWHFACSEQGRGAAQKNCTAPLISHLIGITQNL